MLKKARLLTRPTLARRDAPFPKQGRSELSLGWLRWSWPRASSQFPISFSRVAWSILDCARRTI